MSVHADSSGLDDLAHDFEVAAAKAADEVHAVVKRGSVNVKNDWRRRAKVSAGAHGKAYPSSIGFDIYRLGNRTAAEIGPDKDKRQGALGNLLEYGSVNNAPKPDGQHALDAEEPKFIREIEAAVLRALD